MALDLGGHPEDHQLSLLRTDAPRLVPATLAVVTA